MKIRYDAEKMKRILSDLSVLTGISMSFLDTERRTLCSSIKDNDYCSLLQLDEKNKNLCACSDDIILDKCMKSKRFESHMCHAGLFDAAMPIIKDGIFAGIVLMGRMRKSGESRTVACVDPVLAEKFRAVPEIGDAQIESLGSLLPNVLFESAIVVEYDDRINEIETYIKNNLREPLCLEHICKKFHVSKNSLYGSFREYYGQTVNDHISALRIEKAKELLRSSRDPICLVAEKVGIDNDTYFCKLFKKRVGMTPTQYRRGG